MASLLPFNKLLQDRDQEKTTEQKIQEERESFRLANPKAIWVIAKIAALGICLILNWNFWTRVLPGAFGYVIATLATIAEVMAFVCWMSIDRSAGKFRVALITVASYLTLLSVAHASIEYWRETDLIRGANGQIKFYADYLSLGVMIISIIGSAFALQIMHWRNKVNRERALAEEQMSIGSARLAAEQAKMRQENDLDRARLNQLNEQLQIQAQFVDKIKELADVHKAAESAINSIPDPALRANVKRSFGEVAVIGDQGKDQSH